MGSAAQAFAKARSEALARLGRNWPRLAAEHEDIVQECWPAFERAYLTETGVTNAPALLSEMADKNASSRRRKSERRASLAEGHDAVISARSAGSGPGDQVDHERPPQKRLPRVRGYARGPDGFLHLEGTTYHRDLPPDEEGRVVTVVAGVVGKKRSTKAEALLEQPQPPITPAMRRAAERLEFTLWPFGEEFATAERASIERLGRAYRGAFGHDLEDASWVELASDLAHSLTFAKRGPNTPSAVRDHRGPFPPWVTNRLLREMLESSALGRGGGPSRAKNIKAVVRACVNAHRAKQKPRLRPLSLEELFG